jgi:hypothetical protein
MLLQKEEEDGGEEWNMWETMDRDSGH